MKSQIPNILSSCGSADPVPSNTLQSTFDSAPWSPSSSSPSVDLGQRQRPLGAHAISSRSRDPRRFPSPFSSTSAKSAPCNQASVFRSSQLQLPGLLPASCWGFQVSLSIQRQPRLSCTASTLNILPAALPGQASCLSLGRWRAPRSIITPAAMQMVASIALEAGGKGFVWRRKKPSPLRPGGGFLLFRQATDSGRDHVPVPTSVFLRCAIFSHID